MTGNKSRSRARRDSAAWSPSAFLNPHSLLLFSLIIHHVRFHIESSTASARVSAAIWDRFLLWREESEWKRIMGGRIGGAGEPPSRG